MNDDTNQTFVYDGYTATAKYDTEAVRTNMTCDAETNQTFGYGGYPAVPTFDVGGIRTNMTYDKGVDEPIIFERPKDPPDLLIN